METPKLVDDCLRELRYKRVLMDLALNTLATTAECDEGPAHEELRPLAELAIALRAALRDLEDAMKAAEETRPFSVGLGLTRPRPANPTPR